MFLNFFRLIDTENRLTDNCQREGGFGGWVRRVKGLRKEIKETHGHDNMVIARGKGVGGGSRKERGDNRDGRRLDLGW